MATDLELEWAKQQEEWVIWAKQGGEWCSKHNRHYDECGEHCPEAKKNWYQAETGGQGR